MKIKPTLKHKLLMGLVALSPSSLYASTVTTGGALAWEAPVARVTQSLTGPVATSIGGIAFFVAGAILIFGSEVGDFAKRVLYAVLAASLMIFGSNILSALGLGGSVI